MRWSEGICRRVPLRETRVGRSGVTLFSAALILVGGCEGDPPDGVVESAAQALLPLKRPLCVASNGYAVAYAGNWRDFSRIDDHGRRGLVTAFSRPWGPKGEPTKRDDWESMAFDVNVKGKSTRFAVDTSNIGEVGFLILFTLPNACDGHVIWSAEMKLELPHGTRGNGSRGSDFFAFHKLDGFGSSADHYEAFPSPDGFFELAARHSQSRPWKWSDSYYSSRPKTAVDIAAGEFDVAKGQAAAVYAGSWTGAVALGDSQQSCLGSCSEDLSFMTVTPPSEPCPPSLCEQSRGGLAIRYSFLPR
jgi:hypothetical protein